MRRRSLSISALPLALVGVTAACTDKPAPPRKADAAATARSADQPEPEHFLIRFACQGFDKAVAAGTDPKRLLSTSAMHAVELGGQPVEQATQKWALLPPQGLLELVERYERDAKPDPAECAGLREHLETMSQQAAAR